VGIHVLDCVGMLIIIVIPVVDVVVIILTVLGILVQRLRSGLGTVSGFIIIVIVLLFRGLDLIFVIIWVSLMILPVRWKVILLPRGFWSSSGGDRTLPGECWQWGS
jgi:hypothetical protein